ncbi:hypothetical protein GFB56_00310 [Ensifer sp. T173]|uniref:Uncharacterized protein n=1 Tax=Ensifer canadensis TaxID=555315 RepID=A0AAW4FAU2_9HYPH|nr:hypothetical protein [Ensifer canadensis]MBM3089262.1 hypothetical protein [Ensifer canadensis]UBI76814.1 hypothetical protein J3R84_06715 [Ensifer canadensis]
MQTYVHSGLYHHTIDQLETIARTFDPAAPDILRTRIIEALGDLGIWPASVFEVSDERKAAA